MKLKNKKNKRKKLNGEYLEKSKAKNTGITLIALVVTIIILLILAGISITAMAGQNGLITRTSDAASSAERASLIERVQTDIAAQKLKNKSSNISRSTLKDILDKYFDNVPSGKDLKKDTELIAKDEYGGSKVGLPEIYGGTLEEVVEITITGDAKQTTLPITLTINVTSNGESAKQAKYEINTKSENIGTDSDSYSQTVDGATTIKIDNTGDNYLHVLTTDENKKKTETIKGPISITTNYHEHTGSSESGIGCYTSAISHKHDDTNCYTTTTQSYKASIRYEGQTYGDGTWYRSGFCTACGAHIYQTGSSGGWGSDTPHTHTKTVKSLTCTKTIDGYALGCGKTGETITGYTVSY